MSRYRKVKLLSRTDAAYIAGFIDGEGTISLTRRHRQDNRQLAVTISNTELSPLMFVRDTSGAGRITSKLTYRENHARSYTYGLFNRQALALLGQIEPYLRSYKADRARLVLRDYVKLTPRNGKYSGKQMAARERFIEAFFAITANRTPNRHRKP